MSGKRFTGCLLFLAVLIQQAQADPACDGATITTQGGTICAPRNNRPPTVEIKAPSIEDLGQQLRHEVADAQAARRAGEESAERYAQELTIAAAQSQKSAAALQQQLTAALADLAKARQAYEQQTASLAALQQRLAKGLDVVAGIGTLVDQRVGEAVDSHRKDWTQPVKELQAAMSDRTAELEQRLTARQTTAESRLAALETAGRAHDAAVSSIGKLVDEKVGSAVATGLSESAKRLSDLEATSGKLAQDAAASHDANMNRFKAIDALANQASALADQAGKLTGATSQLDRRLSEGLAPLQAIDQRLTKLQQTGTERYDAEEGLRKQLAALAGRADDNAKELQALRQSSSDQAARLSAVPGLVDQRIDSELGTNQVGQGGEKLAKAPGDGRPGSPASTIGSAIQQLQQRMDQQDTASSKRDSANAAQLADLTDQIAKLQAAAAATAKLPVAAASQSSAPSPTTSIDVDFQQQLRAVLAEQARRLAAVEQKVEEGRVGQASQDAPAPGRVLTQGRPPQLAAASPLNCAALTPDNVGMWDTAVAKAYPGFRLVYIDSKAGNAWVGVPGGATQAAPLRFIAERAGCAG